MTGHQAIELFKVTAALYGAESVSEDENEYEEIGVYARFSTLYNAGMFSWAIRQRSVFNRRLNFSKETSMFNTGYAICVPKHLLDKEI